MRHRRCFIRALVNLSNSGDIFGVASRRLVFVTIVALRDAVLFVALFTVPARFPSLLSDDMNAVMDRYLDFPDVSIGWISE